MYQTPYFSRDTKNLNTTPVQRWGRLANLNFNTIQVAEVTNNAGNGNVMVVTKGPNASPTSNDTNSVREIPCTMLNPYVSQKPSYQTGTDPGSFEDSQTTSGACFPAPQPGTLGLVAFAEDNPNMGYWLGAFLEPGTGHTIPDFASTDSHAGSRDQVRESPSEIGYPAGENVKQSLDGSEPTDRRKRPIHPFTERLREQGLLVDTVRGQTTSSAMRDQAGQVLGFNTPGAPGTSTQLSPGGSEVKVTRLGGHTFSMDDGTSEGKNNLVRIRSSKGHQLLLHDTEELVYIANGTGNCWIELTSDGKVDIYAKDSVSIHTNADFNFRADRDVNIEAGRNINLKSVERFKLEGEDMEQLATNDYKIDVRNSYDLNALDTRFHVRDFGVHSDNFDITNKLNYKIKSSEYDLNTAFGMTLSAGTGVEIKSNELINQIWKPTYNATKIYNKGQSVVFNNLFYEAATKTVSPAPVNAPVPPGGNSASGAPAWIPLVSIPPFVPKVTHTDIRLDSKIGVGGGADDAKVQVLSQNDIVQTSLQGSVFVDSPAGQIHLNKPGPPASPTEIASITLLTEASPTSARGVVPFTLWDNPVNDPDSEWAETTYLTTNSTNSIMRRIPEHEPWTNHETQDREATSKYETDREAE